MEHQEIRILLVEDDEEDYIITRDLLSEARGVRFRLDWVRRYEAALEAMEADQHDVWLVDYRLGAYSGLDLVRQVAGRDYAIPIIVLTGQGSYEVDVEAMKAGAVDYLVKGEISAPLLERSIRYAVRRERSRRWLQALNQVATAMEQALTREEMFDAVADVSNQLGIYFMVLFTDESPGSVSLRYMSYEAGAIGAAERLAGPSHEDTPMPAEMSDMLSEVVEEGKCLFLENEEDVLRQMLSEFVRRFSGPIGRTLRIPKVAIAPLIAKDEVIGALVVQSDDLSAEDMPAITAFAHQMAAAWRKADLLQDLQHSLEELKQTQAQFLQAQKMEAIGILAGGVAHDFNNLLTPIQGYTGLMMKKVDRADLWYEWLQQIHFAAMRAAGLIRQLLLFSRQEPMAFKPLSLKGTVENLMKMLARLIGEDITIHTSLETDEWTIEGDVGSIEQVITNLVVNGRDAMPEGGTLTIRTGNVVFPSPLAGGIEGATSPSPLRGRHLPFPPARAPPPLPPS